MTGVTSETVTEGSKKRQLEEEVEEGWKYLRRLDEEQEDTQMNMFLEEPFDRTNAARAVCSDQKWAIILEALLSTRDVVEHGGSGLGLDDLGPSNSFYRR